MNVTNDRTITLTPAASGLPLDEVNSVVSIEDGHVTPPRCEIQESKYSYHGIVDQAGEVICTRKNEYQLENSERTNVAYPENLGVLENHIVSCEEKVFGDGVVYMYNIKATNGKTIIVLAETHCTPESRDAFDYVTKNLVDHPEHCTYLHEDCISIDTGHLSFIQGVNKFGYLPNLGAGFENLVRRNLCYVGDIINYVYLIAYQRAQIDNPAGHPLDKYSCMVANAISVLAYAGIKPNQRDLACMYSNELTDKRISALVDHGNKTQELGTMESNYMQGKVIRKAINDENNILVIRVGINHLPALFRREQILRNSNVKHEWDYLDVRKVTEVLDCMLPQREKEHKLD